MPKGYWIAHATVTNPDRCKDKAVTKKFIAEVKKATGGEIRG